MDHHQYELKKIAVIKALDFVPDNEIIGIGTGTTINCFIDVLKNIKHKVKGAVSTSKKTTELLKEIGIEIIDANHVNKIPLYIDSADEINHLFQMIKGGGGALLSEKILANMADKFICIADQSKYIRNLGKFPVAVEVIPSARSMVSREILRLGGRVQLRLDFLTERGNNILDVYNLNLNFPYEMEDKLNKITGVVENGIFAKNSADILILGTDKGAQVIKKDLVND